MSDIDKAIEELSPRKRELLELLLKERKTKGAPAPRTISRREKGDSFMLSFAQQRLWFLDKLEPGTPVYNVPFSRRLKGPLNQEALERSLKEIVRRHEILRSSFALRDGRPVGQISEDLPIDLKVIDLTDLPEARREIEARALAEHEARQPFDLSRGPLIRAALLRLGDEDHVVLFTLHHIVSDGWSLGVLLKEVAGLYNAFCARKPSPLSDLPIQYADYAAWQREWMDGEPLQKQLSYWKERLHPIPPVLELPFDRPRTPVRSARGATTTFKIRHELYEAIKVLSNQEAVTPFMSFLAAFQVLLHRYTDREDIAVGAPVANRNLPETEGLIGFFVNTLVLRTKLSGDPTFKELLARVREVSVGAFANQDLPFEKLVQELQPERDLSHTPLFQVMFTLQNVPTTSLDLIGLAVSPFESGGKTAMFDLTLTLMERADEALDGQPVLTGYAEYNTELFDAEIIGQMIRRYENLLEGIASNPHQRLSELPLLNASEKHELLKVWNDTSADYPGSVCLHELFELQASRTPDACAAVFGDQQLSYAELNARSNQLARYLQALGVGPETLVGVCMQPSFDVAVALLGALKAGGAYMPLDPAYPKDRLRFMLEDAGAAVLLTQSHLLDRLPQHQGRTLSMDSEWRSVASHSDQNGPNPATAHNAAYVIYTSGSAGRPKGALITHQAIVNHNLAIIKRYGLTPEDRALQFASLSFDVAAEEIFPTWLAGATVVFRSDAMLAANVDLLDLIAKERLTVLNLPASFWHDWVARLTQSSKRLSADFRLLILGSEKVSSSRLADWEKIGGNSIAIFNAYGPTEATITATLYEPQDAESYEAKPYLPIGRPVTNTQVYLLDSHGQPVPAGVWGELHIGGAGLARGYLNRPDLTAEKFVPDPFNGKPGAQLYSTGDIARLLRDGNIELSGRSDDQVKIRGFRIETREIEAVLATHAAVQQCFVMAREDSSGHKHLAAYVVSRIGQKPAATELRSFLRERLPEYMVPSGYVMLTALPLTPNGKVDRQALPEPEKRSAETDATYVAPRTETEKTIAGIWREVIGLEKAGVNDNFFDLGGHSLLMAEIFAKLRAVIDKDFSLVELFEYPTIASLAKFLTRDKGERSSFHQQAAMDDKLKEGKSRLQQRFRQMQQAGKRR